MLGLANQPGYQAAENQFPTRHVETTVRNDQHLLPVLLDWRMTMISGKAAPRKSRRQRLSSLRRASCRAPLIPHTARGSLLRQGFWGAAAGPGRGFRGGDKGFSGRVLTRISSCRSIIVRYHEFGSLGFFRFGRDLSYYQQLGKGSSSLMLAPTRRFLY